VTPEPHSVRDSEERPIGHAWLHHALQLPVPPPSTKGIVGPQVRRTVIEGGATTEYYPLAYAVPETVEANLKFALRREPVDLGIIVATLEAMDTNELGAWVRAEPTGTHSRRAWFLYERFTGRTLDIPDASRGNYVPALDPMRHVVAERRNSRRHRVIDNLLGGPRLCPMVRLTPRLRASMDMGLAERAHRVIEEYDTDTLARAIRYLYTKETRSSFAIERETPSATRTERFVAALEAAPTFDPSDKAAILELQGSIVDPRYAASDWRREQNFVGETVGGFWDEIVHFVPPRPEDVDDLMHGWMELTDRVVTGNVDPVVAAAVSSFAFVFIHPFMDGNGRIHRFLIHHVLAKRAFGPEGVVLPVSAAIVRDMRGYDEALETFSRPLARLIDWRWTPEREIVVDQETAHLYRYFDATALAEYLYDRVADSIERDLRQELGFIATFDRALAATREIVDMPDRRASLFIRLCLQNGGTLATDKRSTFAELRDDEIAALERAVRTATAGDR
jgi:hypothetical protein